MGKYFGTDGFRGEANRELTAAHAYRVGRFLGWYFARSKESGERVNTMFPTRQIFLNLLAPSGRVLCALVCGLRKCRGEGGPCYSAAGSYKPFCALCVSAPLR